MNEPIHIISLGAGVQSSTMALMASHGEITPMPVAAIFADTQAEPKSVLEWLKYLETKLKIPVYQVTAGNLLDDTLSSRPTGKFLRVDIPAFVVSKGKVDGLINRSCTRDYKIKPIETKTREIVGGKPRMKEWRSRHATALSALAAWGRICKTCRMEKRPLPLRPKDAWDECQADPLAIQWIGISLDESHRMKPSRTPWIFNRWPLIEQRMNRQNCLMWMQRNGYPQPPKSSCIFCPYHSNHQWFALPPDEREIACDLDDRMRQEKDGKKVRLKGELFLHKSGKPLRQVYAEKDANPDEEDLFGNECSGVCNS